MLNDPHLEQKPSPWFIYLHEYCQFLQTEKRYSTHTLAAIQHDVANIQHLPWPPTPAMLKAVLVAATTAGKAPKTLARWASSWRGLFRFAVHQGYLNSNPAEALRTPKPQQALPKAVAIDPLMALMSAPLPTATPGSAQHWQLQAQVLMQLLYGTGMRLSEALSLRCPSHLGGLAHQQGNSQDKHLGVLNVQEGSVRIQGKGNKIRTVPLLGVVVQGLQTLLQLRAEYLALKAKPITAKPQTSESQETTHAHDAVFISRKGQALHPRQAQKDIAQCAAQLGLPQHLHPHMLRHSFGSHMLQSTQNLRAVQELLGHASIRSTQVYTALDFAHLSAVYDKAFPRAK